MKLCVYVFGTDKPPECSSSFFAPQHLITTTGIDKFRIFEH